MINTEEITLFKSKIIIYVLYVVTVMEQREFSQDKAKYTLTYAIKRVSSCQVLIIKCTSLADHHRA